MAQGWADVAMATGDEAGGEAPRDVAAMAHGGVVVMAHGVVVETATWVESTPLDVSGAMGRPV
jgi:hypothetical protein